MKKNVETAQAETEHQTAETTESGTEEKKVPSQCDIDALIRKRVYAAVGLGMIPVPLVDLAGLTAIQMELIHALAQAHGVESSQERVKSLLASLGGSMLTVATVPLFASLFKSIPFIGTTAGAATVCITGGAATYAVGCVFDRHFREGGDLLNFDSQGAKTYFKTKMDEGKEIVAKMKPKKKGQPENPEPATAE